MNKLDTETRHHCADGRAIGLHTDRSRMSAALLRSGYLLEQRIERKLTARGLEVYPSRPIADPRTGIPREVDLFARKQEHLIGDHTDKRPVVGIGLIIECVNNIAPIAVFEKAAEGAEIIFVPTVFGVPLFIPDRIGGHGRVRTEDQAGISVGHRCPAYATQYCTFVAKKSGERELMATHPDDLHKTFDKLVDTVEQVVHEMMPEGHVMSASGGWLTIVRPVLVLQGELCTIVTNSGEVELQSRDHSRYLRRAIVGGLPRAWMIDLVTETGLDMFLDGSLRDAESLKKFCNREQPRVALALEDQMTRRLSLSIRASSRYPW